MLCTRRWDTLTVCTAGSPTGSLLRTAGSSREGKAAPVLGKGVLLCSHFTLSVGFKEVYQTGRKINEWKPLLFRCIIDNLKNYRPRTFTKHNWKTKKKMVYSLATEQKHGWGGKSVPPRFRSSVQALCHGRWAGGYDGAPQLTMHIALQDWLSFQGAAFTARCSVH